MFLYIIACHLQLVRNSIKNTEKKRFFLGPLHYLLYVTFYYSVMSQTESCRYQKEGLKSQANKNHPTKLDFYSSLCHKVFMWSWASHLRPACQMWPLIVCFPFFMSLTWKLNEQISTGPRDPENRVRRRSFKKRKSSFCVIRLYHSQNFLTFEYLTWQPESFLYIWNYKNVYVHLYTEYNFTWSITFLKSLPQWFWVAEVISML